MNLLCQKIMPQHLCSRAIRCLSHNRTKWLKNYFIQKLIREHHVNLNDALNPDINTYEHFNAFFTRALKAEARPIDNSPTTIISPVDGTVAQTGKITNQQLLQAKGKHYSLPTLLGGNEHLAQTFNTGYFATIYLSPRDYHRVHMPLNGTLSRMIYVPGKLFSVNHETSQQVDNLFTLNERVICLFETAIGPIAVIFVGAIFVGNIRTVWHGPVTPPYKKEILDISYPLPDTTAPHFDKGQEIGRFDMGSTVILLLPQQQDITPSTLLKPTQTIQMGQAIASSHPLIDEKTAY